MRGVCPRYSRSTVRTMLWTTALALLVNACAGLSQLKEQAGRDLASLDFDGLAGGSGYGHLGLPEGQAFRLGEVVGDVLVLELFNSNCASCRIQARDLQAFHQAVTTAEGLRGVSVLAVGMGERNEALVAFRSSYHTSYPMVPDPEYDVYGALGTITGTPTILFLARDVRDGWRVAGVLRGLHDREELLAELRRVRAGNGTTADLAAEAVRFDPPMGLDEEARKDRVLALFQRVDPTVTAVKPLGRGAGEWVFRAVGQTAESLNLFARIASRNPPCDVCHTTHLAVVFDRQGEVLGLDLIYAPKAGNVPFDREEHAAVQARLVGRSMAELTYNPSVDAVTSATITTGVIYDEVRRTAALLPGLN